MNIGNMLLSVRLIFVAICLCLSLPAVSGGAAYNGSFKLKDATVHFIAFALSTVDVKVVGPEASGGERDDFLSDKASRPGLLAMLNGGYLASFAPLRPLGLVRKDGKNLSRPVSTWLGGGMVCFDRNRVSITSFNIDEANKYRDCIQSGPLIISDGVGRYDKNEQISAGEERLLHSIQDQSFICVDKNGKFVLGYSEPIALIDLVNSLLININCVYALRMSGSDTAGMVIGKTVYGNTELKIHNAIAVFKK